VSDDSLLVQVALRFNVPENVSFRPTRKMMQDILDRIVAHKRLPKNVEIRGIFWRNPTRGRKYSGGPSNRWRYHEGADLRLAPQPLETSPRGSLRDAIDTLGNAIASGIVTF
jgi:hypothetical protein